MNGTLCCCKEGQAELVRAYVKGDSEEAKVSGASAPMDAFPMDTERLLSGQRKWWSAAKHVLDVHASAALKTPRSQVKEILECIHILILLVYLIFNMGLEVEALLDDRLCLCDLFLEFLFDLLHSLG